MSSTVNKVDALIAYMDSYQPLSQPCISFNNNNNNNNKKEIHQTHNQSQNKKIESSTISNISNIPITEQVKQAKQAPTDHNNNINNNNDNNIENNKSEEEEVDIINKYNLPENATFNKLIPALYHTLTPPANDKLLKEKILNGYKYYKELDVFNCVSAWMSHYNGNDWKKYMQLDKEVYKMNPTFNSYTRHLVASKKNTFRLMVLCWPGNVESPIHDHGGSECWLRVISGQLEEQFYETPQSEDEPLKLKFKKVHKAGAVCFINDEQGLHRIVNPSSEKAVSLHCYVPGYDKCHAFLDEKCAKSGKKQCIMSYSSVGGKHTKH